jgi:hypothetical protein
MSSFRRGACVALASCALLFVACDKKKEAAAPPSSGMPPLDQPTAPAPPGDRPVHAPAGASGEGAAPSLPPGHPPIMPSDNAQAAGGQPQGGAFAGATPGGEFDPKTVLEGVIKVDGKVKDKVAAGDVLFLVARKYEEGSTAPGTPLAVRKLTVDKFPIKFSLDSRDAMLVGTKLAGKVVVTARVDKDGDAMTKNPGDVTGQSKPVEPPKKDVVVSLDTVL